MKKLILVGAGGHAKSIIDIILSTKMWEIAGIVGLESELGKSILDIKVKWTDKDLQRISKEYKYVVLAIGEIGSTGIRVKKIKDLELLGFKLPTIISPKSYVSKYSKIEEGCTIGHFAIVNANCNIGKHCIINTQSLIEHDTQIGDFSHISTSVTINGGVKIGSESFIGSKVMIREGLSLPRGTIISAGKRVMGWPLK